MSQSATEIESTTESGASEMKSFLTNALNAQSEQVDQVMVKIQNAGVSYQDFLQFSEEDLRSVLKQKDLCNISNPLYIGRIISSLKSTDGSAIYQENNRKATSPSLSQGGFLKIYVSPEETTHFTKLTKALKVTTDAANLIQGAIHKLEDNRQATLKAIDSAFNEVYEDLEQRKSTLNKETNDVAQRKQNVLKQQLQNLTKYKETLQLAETEYHKTLENPQLHDRDRKEKNISDINKAINGQTKYEQREPIISPEIAFIFEYEDIAEGLREYGDVLGTMKPPQIEVSDAKTLGKNGLCCTIKVEAHEESEDCPLKLESFQIKFEGAGAAQTTKIGGDDDSKDGDDEEKTGEMGPNLKIVDMGISEESVTISGLTAETEYKFWARVELDYCNLFAV